MRLSAGQQIGNYTLNYRLGQGGMAEVWAARHRVLDVEVALKVLFNTNPAIQKRLLREGRAQAAMNHPNILPVRDFVIHNGSPGLILPLINGPSLDKLLRKYRLTLDEAAALFRSIVTGVGHAHQRGLVHRDLKPGNVLLEERRGRIVPRVADFGLVKDTRDMEPTRSLQTRAGAMMGTLNYAAPEQILDASSVDHRADLFSLGIILVELLTGKRPFQASSLGELLEVYRRGPDLTEVPEDWEPICEELLEANPEHRTSDIEALFEQIALVYPATGADALASHQPLAKAVRTLVRPAPPPAIPPSLQAAMAREAPQTWPGFNTADATGSALDSWSGLLSDPDTLDPPNNLPEARDAFIGRAAALQKLATALETSRLVSILGTGGTGKTRLALRFARQHRAAYPGGVYFFDFSEAKTLEGILFVVSQVLDVPLKKVDPVVTLGHAIAGRGRCLLLFDNFEQTADFAAETVGVWFARTSEARFVVTSRVLLDLSEEKVIRLSPLLPSEAVTLFATRAMAKKTNFTLTDTNRPDVETLVKQLDYLPLAIELAAARIRIMKPTMMLKRMGQRFRLLSSGRTDTGHRQATLRAAINWSWELLETWEKRAFAQCSVFEGGFTLEAAEAVMDLDDVDDASWVLDAVQSLVDKSLLRALGENRLGEKRFGMLMSLHEYATEKLLAGGVDAVLAVQQRHAAYFATFGEDDALAVLSVAKGIERWWSLSLELDNLLVAVQRATEQEWAIEAGLAALAVQSNVVRHGPFAVGIDALRAAQRVLSAQESPALLAKVFGRLGSLYQKLGKMELAEQHFTNGLAIAQEIGDRHNEGMMLGSLGALYGRQGRMALTEQHYTNALTIAQEIGDRHNECIWLGNLGALHISQGRMDQARRYYTSALTIAQEVENQRLECLWLGNLGNLHRLQGQSAEAEPYYTHALIIAQTIGDRRLEGGWLGSLGILHQNQGRIKQAEQHYTSALTIARQIGDRQGEGGWLGNLGNLHKRQGRLKEAERFYTDALTIAQEIGHQRSEGAWLGSLGNLHRRQGRTEVARQYFKRSLIIAIKIGNRHGEGMMLGNLGDLYKRQRQTGEAKAHYQRALSIYREIGDQRSEGEMLGELGLLEALGGALEAGLALLKQGEGRLREINAPIALGQLLCKRSHAEHLAHDPGAATASLHEARQIAEDLDEGDGSELVQKIAEAQAILDEAPASSGA